MTAGGAQALTEFLAAGDARQNEAFREIVETLPVAVYATDAEGRLTYFNDAARKLSGRMPELGTDKWCVTWKIFLPDGTPLPHDQCPMAMALKGESVPNGIECVAERPDGTRFWFTPYPAVLRDGEGRIVGAVNVLVDITDRRTAEIEAREQFRAIIETTPECVKIVARDGTLLFMNAQGLGMVGAASAEAITGMKVYDLIAPEDRERFQEFNERICRGEKGSIEFDIVSLQGVRRKMESHAAPLRHVDGSTVQLAVTHDISEQNRAERADVLLSAIVDSSDDAIISKDLNGIITTWNKSAERLFGYTAAEAVGESVTMLIPSDRLEEEPKILSRLRRGDRVDHFETLRRRKDGSLLDISLTISPVRDARGRIIGASKIARDITLRKRDEQRLAEQTRLLDLSCDAILVRDREDHILDWNRGAEEMYGFSREEALGKISHDLLRTEFTEPLPQIRETLLRDGRWSGELIHVCCSGSRIVTLSRWVVECAANGHVVRILESNNDITERVRAQAQLRRANQDLEHFAYSACHDLREPLRTVNLYSELLATRYSGKFDGDSRMFLDHVSRGAAQMETLLSGLMVYAETAGQERSAELTDAAGVLNDVLTGLTRAIEESGAYVTFDPLPSVPIHRVHLRQLLQNLVSNAVKFHRPDQPPIVHLSARRENGDWVFCVADNGIGIAPEYHNQVFGLFQRLHSAERYSGSGIGLALCHRIVELYRGRIWIESHPGQGSTFYFALPA